MTTIRYLIAFLICLTIGFNCMQGVKENLFDFIESTDDETSIIDQMNLFLINKNAEEYINADKIQWNDSSHTCGVPITTFNKALELKKYTILRWLIEHPTFDLNILKKSHSPSDTCLQNLLYVLKKNPSNQNIVDLAIILVERFKEQITETYLQKSFMQNNYHFFDKLPVNDQTKMLFTKLIIDLNVDIIPFFIDILRESNSDFLEYLLTTYPDKIPSNQILTSEKETFLDLGYHDEACRKILLTKGLSKASKTTYDRLNQWYNISEEEKNKITVTTSWTNQKGNRDREKFLAAIAFAGLLWDLIAYQKLSTSTPSSEENEMISKPEQDTHEKEESNDIVRLLLYVKDWGKDIFKRPSAHKRLILPLSIVLTIRLFKDSIPCLAKI